MILCIWIHRMQILRGCILAISISKLYSITLEKLNVVFFNHIICFTTFAAVIKRHEFSQNNAGR